jgi:hypothetical protein
MVARALTRIRYARDHPNAPVPDKRLVDKHGSFLAEKIDPGNWIAPLAVAWEPGKTAERMSHQDMITEARQYPRPARGLHQRLGPYLSATAALPADARIRGGQVEATRRIEEAMDTEPALDAEARADATQVESKTDAHSPEPGDTQENGEAAAAGPEPKRRPLDPIRMGTLTLEPNPELAVDAPPGPPGGPCPASNVQQ